MTYVDRVTPFAFAVTAPEPAAAEAESAVIRRAQARDTRAFETLYRTHLGRIYAVCLRMTANPNQAEELTQQAFLTAWQKLPLFRGESAFSSWLHRVAVNTVLAAFRADSRRTSRVFGTEDPAAFETPPPAPPAGIRLDLEAAIAALPPQARTVFVLHDVEGWLHEEIAHELGVATGTSKAQLHRARKLLQEALR
ncbi:MAG: sigma-70 family RNA polymerase sigma factor [Verrucomicrobiota bacterium]